MTSGEPCVPVKSFLVVLSVIGQDVLHASLKGIALLRTWGTG